MQIEQIETFLDLCETRSFNRTAERLGVTQSTVSARIAALERGLGRRLFTRGRAGAAPTTEGLAFEPHARGLRLGWAEAVRAARGGGTQAMSLRIGLQQDLAGTETGPETAAIVAALREALPGAALYIEADYSTQMCADLISGDLDIAVLFTPKPHPDLYFESLGEIAYRMVSSETDRLSEVRAESYILGNYAPAFHQAHAALLPALHAAPVASGQTPLVTGLVTALGGAAYVMEARARALVQAGGFRMVADAPAISQPVYAALHLRNRHRRTYRVLTRVLAEAVPGR